MLSLFEDTTMGLPRQMHKLVLVGLGIGLFIARALAGNDTVEDRLRQHITFLASDVCEGRGPGTKGIDKAANYIAEEFRKAGLKPGGPMGSYFQPFTVTGVAELAKPGSLVLHGSLGQTIELRPGIDFRVMGLSGSGNVSASLVFAGYGVTAPGIKYDDYQGVDIAGKIVILLRRTPRWSNRFLAFDGVRKEEHASLERKVALARVNKAAAILIVNDRSEASKGDPFMTFEYTSAAIGAGAPTAQIRRTAVDAILRSSLGMSLADIEQAIDRDLKPRSSPLFGWKAHLTTDVVRKTIAVKNIVGVAEGSGALADETIVIGAHYDHLGYGQRFSLAKEKKKAIHHGADDNGSGTTVLMELARRYGAMPSHNGRRLVFIAFSAEEMGLLGSKHYCNKEPLFPLARTVAMVNLDMVGRLTKSAKGTGDKLIVEGLGTAKEFEKLLDRLSSGAGFDLIKKKGGTGPSDHDSFYRQKIPVLFFWTGMHKDYHRPTDTADKINVRGMKKIATLAERVIGELARGQRPAYVKVAESFVPRAGNIPRLGIMPNYESENEGVLVGGVSDGGPAAKAGLKVGDLIVEIAGRPVTNINTYMAVLGQTPRNQPADVVVLRHGKRVNLKVTPQ
jgi:hypothetical protein